MTGRRTARHCQGLTNTYPDAGKDTGTALLAVQAVPASAHAN